MGEATRDARSVNQVLADNLRYFMEEKGLTQAQMGTRAQMAQTTVSLYLNPHRRGTSKSGKEASAKIAEVQRLADALGVELWELLRPMQPAEREFYRSMEALLEQRRDAIVAEPKGRYETPTTARKKRRAA